MMEKYYWAALQSVNGLSGQRIKRLITFFGSASSAWQAHRRDLFVCGCIDEHICNNLLSQREKINVDDIAAGLKRQGISLVCLEDAEYPALLKAIYNPPPVLYYRGSLPGMQSLIALVGARKASAYGRSAAKKLSGELAGGGMGIVSGAARGIDTAAHEGALQANGYTVAVLGCGVDVVYPRENAKLLATIAEQGCVVSEYMPGTAPLAKFFPARNRIISGLSKGVVVVEAAEKSGALITADFALDEGREVFAVPGSIFSVSSIGTNRLIKQGAKPVVAAADVFEEYDMLQETAGRIENKFFLSGDLKAVYASLEYDVALGLEEIVLKTKIQPQVLTYILLQLELKGLIENYGGQRYIRIPGRESFE